MYIRSACLLAVMAVTGAQAPVVLAEAVSEKHIEAAAVDESSAAEQHAPQLPYGFASALIAAMDYDPGLKRARAQYESEQEDDNLSLAELLPQVSASGGYQYENSDNIYTDEASNFYNPDLARSSGELLDSYWRVDVSQAVVNWEAYQGYKRDRAGVDASEFRYQRAVQELIYQVAERYLIVLQHAQRVYLTEQKLEALELKSVQAERARELEVGDQLSVLRVRASRDLARSDLLKARSELQDAKTLLKNITGQPVVLPQGWVEAGQRVHLSSLSGLDQSWLEAVKENLSVREAASLVEKEKYNLSAQKAGHLPTLSLNLSHVNKESDDEFRERSDSVVALRLNVPLYSGGRQSARVRKAQALLGASEAQLEVLQYQKQQQIELSLNKITSISERLQALENSKQSSQGYLEAAERQMSLNLGDQIAVLDARTDLVDTQLQFAETLHEYLIADLLLRLETGQLEAGYMAEFDQLFSEATQLN